MNMAFDPEGTELVLVSPALAGMDAAQTYGGEDRPGCLTDQLEGMNALAEAPATGRDLICGGGAASTSVTATGADGETGPILLPDGAPAAGAILPTLDIAEVLFGSAASEMTRLLRRLEAGEPIRPKEATDAATETRKALERLQDERNRVEQLRRTLAGGVGDRALDLAAARDEIGRRLACLRDSRGD